MTQTMRAALWMTGAIVAFSSMAVAGRAISLDHDTFEIMLFRSLTGIVIVVTLALACGTWRQINRAQLGLHGLRNLAHFAGQNLWFYALPLIPLTHLFALEFTSPIWVILLAPLLLSERLTSIGLLSALLAVVGVLIVTRPFEAELSVGTIAAGLAAIGFAFSAVFTRKLTRTQTITCILFWLTVMQAVFGLIGAGLDGQIALPTSASLPWLVVIAFAGLIAHFCLTKALAIAPANIVMPMDFIRLPVIAVVAALVYDESLDPLVFLGALIIFGANYLNMTYGQRVKL